MEEGLLLNPSNSRLQNSDKMKKKPSNHTETSIYRRIINLQNKERTLAGIKRINRDIKAVKNPVNCTLFGKVKSKFRSVEQTMTDKKLDRVTLKIDNSLMSEIKGFNSNRISVTPEVINDQNVVKIICVNPSKQELFIFEKKGFRYNGAEKCFIKEKPKTLDGIDCAYEDESDDVGLGKAIVNEDVYKIISDKVLAMIESGEELVWRKPWTSIESYGLPATNFVSKKRYKGINSFLLNFIIPWERQRSWKNPYFLTFKQVKKLGGVVKKDAEGYFVTYFQMIYKKGKELITEQQYYEYFARCAKSEVFENGVNICTELDEIPVLRYYKVFNGEDISGINFKLKKEPKKKETERIQAAEAIIASYPTPRPRFVENDPNGAYYIPSKDVINMPKIEAFEKEAAYYSTFFHEMIHSTGHSKRLDRDLKGGKESKRYAFEELIAELGASFLCGESGILYHTINNSAAYLKSWKRNLVNSIQDDNKFFFRACGMAEKASEFMLQRNKMGVPKYLKQLLQKSAAKKQDRPPARSRIKSVKQVASMGNLEVPEPISPVAPNQDGILTADEILNTNFETLPFNGKWEELMQSPASNLTAIVYGKPKNGKTSFSFQFADYLSVFGPVLYVLADQGIGQATKKLITDMKVHGNSNLFFMGTRDLQELDEKISNGDFKFIFLDLINNFQISAQQMEDFIHKHRDKGFILVMESTKNGDFRGEQKWTHIVDSIIKVENFVADNTGRYGSGSYSWPNPNSSI